MGLTSQRVQLPIQTTGNMGLRAQQHATDQSETAACTLGAINSRPIPAERKWMERRASRATSQHAFRSLRHSLFHRNRPQPECGACHAVTWHLCRTCQERQDCWAVSLKATSRNVGGYPAMPPKRRLATLVCRCLGGLDTSGSGNSSANCIHSWRGGDQTWPVCWEKRTGSPKK